MLFNLILSLQTAFVPNRRGLDNVFIAQEIIHTIGQKKGKKGYIAIKIDLVKSYDHLEWNFIRDTLTLFKFPRKLLDLIMNCVSSSTIS